MYVHLRLRVFPEQWQEILDVHRRWSSRAPTTHHLPRRSGKSCFTMNIQRCTLEPLEPWSMELSAFMENNSPNYCSIVCYFHGRCSESLRGWQVYTLIANSSQGLGNLSSQYMPCDWRTSTWPCSRRRLQLSLQRRQRKVGMFSVSKHATVKIIINNYMEYMPVACACGCPPLAPWVFPQQWQEILNVCTRWSCRGLPQQFIIYSREIWQEGCFIFHLGWGTALGLCPRSNSCLPTPFRFSLHPSHQLLKESKKLNLIMLQHYVMEMTDESQCHDSGDFQWRIYDVLHSIGLYVLHSIWILIEFPC